ncbi:MAG: PQQ-binding-like beta-propeller repeat protein [Planctomycetota bacterium]
MTNNRFTYLTLLSFLSSFSVAVAGDWPQWMGAGMDGIWKENGIVDTFEPEPDVVWRQPIGSGYGGPSVANGQLFVMDRMNDERGASVDVGSGGKLSGSERILCLDVATGETIWSHQYDCPYTIAYPTGPRCTPTIDGDFVYTLGAMGDLICLKVASGEVVWSKKLLEVYSTKPPLWGFSSHPLVDGDQLLVPVGGEGTGVVAFNKRTGEQLWTAVTTRDIAYAPLVMYEPTDATRQLIFWHADGVTSLDPSNGKEYWTVKFPEEVNPSQTSIATPRIIGDKILISEFYKGSLLLQLSNDPTSVKELWRSNVEDPRHNKSLNSMMTTPVIKDGHFYGVGYVGRGIGTFRCFDLLSGEMKWSKDDWMGEKPTVFATTFIVENDGRYFLFNDNGELMIAKLSPSGFKEISRMKLLEPTSVARGRNVVWSHPAYANRRIYARNDKEIVCVDLAEPS